jgi:hypothetical protein
LAHLLSPKFAVVKIIPELNIIIAMNGNVYCYLLWLCDSGRSQRRSVHAFTGARPRNRQSV